jgi:hypothetical protein
MLHHTDSLFSSTHNLQYARGACYLLHHPDSLFSSTYDSYPAPLEGTRSWVKLNKFSG